MNMTDAEIKELAIKHGLCQPSGDQFVAIDVKQLSFAHELEAVTREKVLAELAKNNPPVAWKRIYHGAINYLDTDKYAQGDVEPLYAMPPVPEGWKLVPIEPNEDMVLAAFNVQRSEWSNPIGHFVSHYKAMLAAAPKKG